MILTVGNGNAKFSFIDLNGDGVLEVITQKYIENMSGYYDYTVYHYENESLMFYYDSGGALSKSGSYKLKLATSRGEYKLVLKDSSIKTEQIWYIGNEGTIFEESYMINYKNVSKEEVEECMKKTCPEAVTWYALNEENIEKYITVESMKDQTYFCNCDNK